MKSKRIIIALMLTANILLVTCVTDPEAKVTPTTPTSVGIPTPTTVSVPMNVPGSSTLTIASPDSIDSLDVHQSYSGILAASGPGISYSRLLRFQSGPGITTPSSWIECDLCESWEQVGSKQFIFQLRDGVVWHDIPPLYGRQLVSEDIAYSLRRQSNPRYPSSYLMSSIESVEAKGKLTLRIDSRVTDSDLLMNLANGMTKIIPPEIESTYGDLSKGPVIGSGPWIFRGDMDGDGYMFEANPNYYEESMPRLDRLNILVIPDEITRVAAFRVGKIDILETPLSQMASIMKHHPETDHVFSRQSGTGIELALNLASSPLDQLNIRKAVFAAINPWEAIDSVWHGTGYISQGIPNTDSSWNMPEADLQEYLAKPSEAKEYISSLPSNISRTLTVSVADYGDMYIQYGDILAKQLEYAGFEVSIVPVPILKYPEDIWYGGKYQIFVGPIPPMGTSNNYLFSVLHSKGAWNTHGYNSPSLDSLIEKQSETLDGQLRGAIMSNIQRHMLEKAVRFMPLTKVSIWFSWPEVKDFHPNLTSNEYFHLAKVSISQ